MQSIFDDIKENNDSQIQDIKDFVKEAKNNFKGSDYCAEMYEKHKAKYPITPVKMSSIIGDWELLSELVHGAVVYFKENQKYLDNDDLELNTKDLINFLNTKPLKIFNPETKELSQNRAGYDFLNYFIRDNMLDVTVAGKSSVSIKQQVKDDYLVYKSICKGIVFNQKITISGIFAALKLTNGAQAVSNFRPLCAYYLYSMGLESMKARGDKTLYIKVPSEGWLGRLLSAYKIAYENPDIQIRYESIDPNIAVCQKFKEVNEYLKSELFGIQKIKNVQATIHPIGSETESACFYNAMGLKFDVIGTSPPYFETEGYTEGYEIKTINLNNAKSDTFKKSELEKVTLLDGNEKTIKELLVGDILADNTQVASKKKTGQSRNKTSSAKAWNETFLRPTFRNNFIDIADTGVLWWNIADVRRHPTFCADSCQIAIEEGLKLIDTYKYTLSRVPGGILKEVNGEKVRVDLRKIKDAFEPVYIYKKA